jgi:thioester reductase-like protein
MPAHLLLTGATGAVGEELLERWLTRTPHRVTMLVRGASDDEARARRAGLVSRIAQRTHGDAWAERLELVRGDVAAPGLGLSAGDRDRLAVELTGIMHSAANTKFSQSAEEAEATNTRGTAHVLELARACRKVEKVGIVSTVYVAGQRTGTIREDDLEHDAGFVNFYEQSKYEAEKLVRRAWNDVPAATYRLSTVLADSRTGEVRQFNALHQSLKLLYHALAPMVPGSPKDPVDLVPIDYAADALYQLFEKFTPRQTFHVCGGSAGCYSLEELLDETIKAFEELSPKWKKRGIARPAIVDLPTYRMFEQSVEQMGNDILLQVLRALSHFAPQLTFPKEFDDARTRKALRGTGIKAQPMKKYFRKVMQYCLDSSWGGKSGLVTKRESA